MFPRHGWLVGSQVEEAAQAKLWRCRRALDGLVTPQRNGASILSDGDTEVQGPCSGTMLKPHFYLPHASRHVLLESRDHIFLLFIG